jgi:hypothetical protein
LRTDKTKEKEMADYRENILKYIEKLDKALPRLGEAWRDSTEEYKEKEIGEMQNLLNIVSGLFPDINIDSFLDSVVEKHKNDPLGNRASTR